MPRASLDRNPNHIVSVLNSPSVSSLSPSPEPQQLSSNFNMVGQKNMRPSPNADTVPVTYTPTTHRISKAKKGKRVHACQHDGCGKVGAYQSAITGITQIDFIRRSSPEPSTRDAMN